MDASATNATSVSPASAGRARTLASATAAVARARAGGAPDAVLGEACCVEARLRYDAFDYVGSYALALEAGELLRRAGDRQRRDVAVNLCFIICIETGDLKRGLDTARRALAESRAERDTGQQALLLHNQAVVFEIMEEFDAAVPCLHEAIHLYGQQPAGGGGVFFARVNLAEVHLAYADRLRSAGDLDAAARRRAQAAEALPPFDAAADLAALHTWISATARLGDLAGARRAAVAYLERVRRSGNVRRHTTYALLALGEYHVQQGRPDKGVHRFMRAIAQLRAADNRSHLSVIEQRLAAVYADNGNFVEALRWTRQAHQDRAHLQGEQQKLRLRLAAFERESEARQARRREVVAHEQRLAVVGGLMAEIYQSLAVPLDDAQQTLVRCALGMVQGQAQQDAEAQMRQVIARIDEATSLTRQLKMFSYRTAPQLIDLDLHEAVAEAWAGLSFWRTDPDAELQLGSALHAFVCVDVQRLAVLLRILLIEAEKLCRSQWQQVDIRAEASDVRLRIDCASLAPRAPVAAVGMTLCEEIAQEMGGALSITAPDFGVVRLELRLPAAGPAPARSSAFG